MEGGDAARALAIVVDETMYAFRIGSFLHVLPLHLQKQSRSRSLLS